MFRGIQNRSAAAWGLGVLLTGFYVLLYWFPQHLERLVRVTDPLARAITGADADRWFLYGLLYTLAVLVFGVRMLLKYRHSGYHRVRTASVMFFQLGFAFLIPYILKGLNRPDFYFSYFWPLKPDYLFPSTLEYFRTDAGAFGQFLVFWCVVISLVAVPVLTYFLGKRWYCSWVCGCGGLAETLGDPFRQLSDKSVRAWIVERWLIHSVLVAIVVVTAALWLHEITGGRFLGSLPFAWKQWYGFFIGAIFSGVIGVGFYPILGSRVWCRFGCPQAAILGIFQRFFSRFRITVNGGQCMSCGNCSTYCEMGIDVRAYAQEGANVVRASCVGCGVCAAVCPRGVLKLENGPDHRGRYPGSDRPLGALREALSEPGRPSVR
jgi:polyferredoxin